MSSGRTAAAAAGAAPAATPGDRGEAQVEFPSDGETREPALPITETSGPAVFIVKKGE